MARPRKYTLPVLKTYDTEFLEVIDTDDDPNRCLCRFKGCSHTDKVLISRLVKGLNIECRECKLESHKKEAIQNGLTLLHKVDEDYYRYSFDICGHEINHTLQTVRKGCVTCPICYYENIKVPENFTKVGKGPCYLKLKCNTCGFVKNHQVSNIKNSIIRCKCELQSHYCKTYMYVVQIEDNLTGVNYVKVGHSYRPSKRYKTYGGVKIITELIKVEYPDRFKAIACEVAIRCAFEEFRREPASMMSGRTECFDISVLDKFEEILVIINKEKE